MLLARREMRIKHATERSQGDIFCTLHSARDGEGAKLIFIYSRIWYSFVNPLNLKSPAQLDIYELAARYVNLLFTQFSVQFNLRCRGGGFLLCRMSHEAYSMQGEHWQHRI